MTSTHSRRPGPRAQTTHLHLPPLPSRDLITGSMFTSSMHEASSNRPGSSNKFFLSPILLGFYINNWIPDQVWDDEAKSEYS